MPTKFDPIKLSHTMTPGAVNWLVLTGRSHDICGAPLGLVSSLGGANFEEQFVRLLFYGVAGAIIDRHQKWQTFAG